MRDNDLTAAKLISATLLTCTGAVCAAIASLAPFPQDAMLPWLFLSVVGALLLVRQWTGRGVVARLGAVLVAVWAWWCDLVREARADAPAAPQRDNVR